MWISALLLGLASINLAGGLLLRGGMERWICRALNESARSISILIHAAQGSTALYSVARHWLDGQVSTSMVLVLLPITLAALLAPQAVLLRLSRSIGVRFAAENANHRSS